MAYVVKGAAIINGEAIQSRTLVRDNGLNIKATADSKIILVYTQ
jgi:hypothetical protein